jgi:hypothetical protein
LAVAIAAFFAATSAAAAAPLLIAGVSSRGIDCTYDPNCASTSTDTSAPISIDGLGGRALLHTRIFTGEFGSPATGLTGYMYRVNMSGAYGGKKAACVSALRLAFGPAVKLPYVSGGPYVDIFVITSGGLGTIGLASAERDGLCRCRARPRPKQLLFWVDVEPAAETCFRAAANPGNGLGQRRSAFGAGRRSA